MVTKLVLFFGRDQALSLSEALFFLKDNGMAFSLEAKEERFAVFSFGSEVSALALLQSLGGTAKIASVLFELERFDAKALEKRLKERAFFDALPEKFFYYSSVLGNTELDAALRDALKQSFKGQKLRAMFKHPKELKVRAQQTMGPSELRRWKLLDSGFELLVLRSGQKLLVCKTVAATDVEALKKRDLQRPAQKPKHEISLRLARILLNLASAGKGKTVLDPFCGTGTIMQEALFNGANAIGLELDAKTAAMAKKNLEWFSQNFNASGVWRVINADSAVLSSLLKKREFDCVVTEPYMGPLINTVLPEQIVKKTVTELEALYSKVFFELSKIMERGQRVVFILPSIPATSGKKIAVSEKVFFEQGFSCINPAGEKLLPYNYQQKTSKILRRIFVLEKT